MLFQAITGKVPYPRETAAATMLAHLDSPPPSLLSVLPDASERLGEVVRRAMAKDPADRFPSAGDLGRAALAAVDDRVAERQERSVATGDASRRPRGARDPAPARAGGRDRPRRVRRPRRRTSSSSSPATPPPRPASASSSCSSGEPGIGKTRLATELARRAHREGATVLYGRSDAESLVPYQPFITAIAATTSTTASSSTCRRSSRSSCASSRASSPRCAGTSRARGSLAEEPETRRYRLFEGVDADARASPPASARWC